MRFLNYKNVYVNAEQVMANEAFMRQYEVTISTFNLFYGTLALAANNALTEAIDAYEGTPVYKFQIKKMFIRLNKEWDLFWKEVENIFEEKYALYIDYLSQTIVDLQTDINNLYYAVDQSLMMQNIPDHDRRAWLFTADLLTHELVRAHHQYMTDIVKHTHNKKLGDALQWADLEHVRRHTHEILRAICPIDISMTDDVHLAMKVIGRKVTDSERQDEAAYRTYNYKEHQEEQEDVTDRIEAFLQHKEDVAKEKEQAKQAELKRREERSRRRRQGKREFLSSDAVADILKEKFNVTRL